jgi:hypothetical protein
MKVFLNIIFVVLIVALSRLIPHWPNLTAIGASTIWMAYSWPQKSYSVLVPILALLISDLVIGFHNQMFWVYGAVILSSLLIQKLGAEFSPKSLIKNSLLSTILFFLVTNFGVWFTGELYTHSASGLVQCYIAGLPFAVNDFLGTLLYGSLGLLTLQKVFQTKATVITSH